MQKTPLFEAHQRAGGKMIDFHGWALPVNYGSQLAEHHRVRENVGVFDVSHMTVFDITGGTGKDFFSRLLPSDVERLKETGQTLYSALLNESGGIIDDLILYVVGDNWLRLVTNCATRSRIEDWLKKHLDHHPKPPEIKRTSLAILALQGPKALSTATDLLPEHAEAITDLKSFHGILSNQVWLARTGYTGEDGLEIIATHTEATSIWERLIVAGVQPAGLGARDTLRLEAGLNLSGQDMDENTSPLVSGLGKIIHWEPENRDFIGRAALAQEKSAGPSQRLVGLVLESGGIPRHDYRVLADGEPCGVVTSGALSPTLNKGIALARIDRSALDKTLSIEIRGKPKPAVRHRIPFYKRPKPAG